MFGWKLLFMFLLSLYILNLKSILSLDRYDKEFGAVIFTNIGHVSGDPVLPSSTFAILLLPKARWRRLKMGEQDLPKHVPKEKIHLEIFRHGDRTPTKSYKNDPHTNISWPGGFGQLTKLGKNQMYSLGKWLRSRYNHLLSEQYVKEEIYIMSTDADRALMSVSCSLAGLYPVKEEIKWNPEINWDPIPIHGLPLKSDKIIGVTANCSKYQQELDRVMESDEVRKILTGYNNLFDYISFHSGDEIRQFFKVNRIFDTLTIQDNNNLSLPEWTASVYPELMREVALYSYRIPTWDLPLQRIKAGPILGEMVKTFKAKKQGILTPNRTVWIYSGHDSTIGNILNSLKMFNFNVPPLASTLLFELRQNASDHFVTVFYRNSSTEEPHLLTLPECEAACPLSDFVTLTQPLIPTDWDAECQHSDNKSCT